MLNNIGALICVLRQLNAVFIQLKIAHFKGSGKLFYLVSGVVHIEFAAYVVTRPFQHGGKAVSYCAAPCVSDVHGACRIRGNEFYEHLFACAEIGFSVVFAFCKHVFYDLCVVALRKIKVQKSRACDLASVKQCARKIKIIRNALRNLSRRASERLSPRQRNVGGKIAVFAVGRLFNVEIRYRLRRQFAVCNGPAECVYDLCSELFLGLFNYYGHQYLPLILF